MSKRLDLTGMTFGEWTVEEYAGNSMWKCRCSCGVEKEVHGYSLRNGKSVSCGHSTEKAFKDLTGQRFGEWTVLEYMGDSMWKCRCSCGVEKNVHRYSLLRGGSKSCGHSTTGFKDLTGKQMGVYKVLKYIGGRKYLCQCKCGQVDEVSVEYLNGTQLVNECQHERNLIGKTFSELTVIGKGSPGKYICRCSCGKEMETDRWSLEQGRKKSCGHNNIRDDLTGRTFGEWLVLSYSGNNYYKCRCSCGVEKDVGAWLLKSGQSKSCGHSKTDFNDIVGKKIGPWDVLEYSGNYRYKCRCTCGKELNILRYTLKHNTQTECVHKKIDCDSLVGKRFGYWTIIESIGKQMVTCRCDCGTERSMKIGALLTGHSRYCGCMKAKLSQETLMKRYGDIATNKTRKPREQWQIETLHSADLLESLMLRVAQEKDRKPSITEVAETLGVNQANAGKAIKKYNLTDLIEFGTSSKKEMEILEAVEEMCEPRGIRVVSRDRSVLEGQELDIYIPEIN